MRALAIEATLTDVPPIFEEPPAALPVVPTIALQPHRIRRDPVVATFSS